jgi:hypothetical protein
MRSCHDGTARKARCAGRGAVAIRSKPRLWASHGRRRRGRAASARTRMPACASAPIATRPTRRRDLGCAQVSRRQRRLVTSANRSHATPPDAAHLTTSCAGRDISSFGRRVVRRRERWSHFKILLQRRDVTLPRDRELVGQIHAIKRRGAPLGQGQLRRRVERAWPRRQVLGGVARVPEGADDERPAHGRDRRAGPGLRSTPAEGDRKPPLSQALARRYGRCLQKATIGVTF